jgi:hypothetical protein
MKPARIFLLSIALLQLCSPVAAATPEQEIEAEAKKLLSTLFSKCGEDHFSKRTFKRKVSSAWIVGQYKDLAVRSRPIALSKADSLNGIQWKGSIHFTASAGRVFPHDTDIPKWTYGTERVIPRHLRYLLVRKEVTPTPPEAHDGKKREEDRPIIAKTNLFAAL